MSALTAAIKREASGEPVRWQASPKPKLRGFFGLRLRPIPLRRPTFVLTDSRLFSIEELSGAHVARSAPVARIKELMAKPGAIAGGNPENAEVRLLQDLHLYCPTTSQNDFKRALDRIH